MDNNNSREGKKTVADYEYKVPISGFENIPVQVTGPAVGASVRIVLMPRYEHNYPADTLGQPDISQLGDVEDYDPYGSLPEKEGTFILDSFKQELSEDGRSVSVEFEMPDRLTVITLMLTQTQFSLRRKRLNTKHRYYSITLLPGQSWQDAIEASSLPFIGDIKIGP